MQLQDSDSGRCPSARPIVRAACYAVIAADVTEQGVFQLNRFEHSRAPLVVGIGGTTRAASSTERALAVALRGAQEAGAQTRLFGGAFLHRLPHYAPENDERTDEQLELIEAVRHADALVIATPGYHGGVSGLVKNALDTLEDLRDDARPYLDGRAAGCIVTAYGWQAAGSVLTSLRSIVHALRGWPTPFGAGINTIETRFDSAGLCSDPKVAEQLATVGRQAAQFAIAFGGEAQAGDHGAAGGGPSHAGAAGIFALAD